MEQVEFRKICECTLDQITELWNVGFRQYFSDMTRTVEQMTAMLGNGSIQPQLSVAAYIDGEPAGFVLIGLKNVHGVKTAWNGGTGINPAFRGRGLSKLLLAEAIRGLREAGVDIVTLEARTDNTQAVAAYRSVGFEIMNQLPILQRTGAFDLLPFRRKSAYEYLHHYGMPEDVSGLPFYLHHTAWNTQWFNARGSRSLLVYDRSGCASGYALFSKSTSMSGDLTGITITHCEADPAREDHEDVVRFMLGRVFGPFDAAVPRTAHYIRSTNETAVRALTEAGFKLNFEEHLMMLQLK